MTGVNPLGNYVRPDNLRARIAIHEYAANPNWARWLFDRELPDEPGAARILDVGCGTGRLWTSNHERIDPAWLITLADSSAGMIEAARGDLGDRAVYVVADIQDLPFEDEAFDIVAANHMLYHVADRARAFVELRRVLRPGGAVHCATNGRGHLVELDALLPESAGIARYIETFGLESGPAQLQSCFDDVTVQRFDNVLQVPSVEPVLAYIRSRASYRKDDDLSGVWDAVVAEIQRDGSFSITTRPGLISARKPPT